MAKKRLRECSVSLAFRERHTETTLRSPLTPSEGLTSRKELTLNVGRDAGGGGGGVLIPYCGSHKLLLAPWKSVWRVPPKVQGTPTT